MHRRPRASSPRTSRAAGTQASGASSCAAGPTTSAGRSRARTGSLCLADESVAEDADDGLLGFLDVLVLARETPEDPAGEHLLERAVVDPGRQPRREIGAEHALLLIVLDD